MTAHPDYMLIVRGCPKLHMLPIGRFCYRPYENKPFLNNQIFITIQPTEVIIQPVFFKKRKEIRMQIKLKQVGHERYVGRYTAKTYSMGDV